MEKTKLVRIDEKIHKLLKIRAAEKGVSVKNLVGRILLKKFAKKV